MLRRADLQATTTDRGDGLVEYALIIPVFLLILMAVLDFGRAIYCYSVVANSAREATRVGAIHSDDDGAIIAAARNSAVGLDQAALHVTVSRPTADTVRVRVQYNFGLVTPLIAQVIGGATLPLQSTATMYTGY